MSIMYVSKEGIRHENEKKIKMLALFNTLTEEDKDFVISMSDSLVRKHEIFIKTRMNKNGEKSKQTFTN
jgi:hypothetical protein